MAFSAIYDSNDERVGELISLTNISKALVQFKISGKYYVLPVYTDRIGDEAEITLYYTTEDCSDQAYVNLNIPTEDGEDALFPVYNLTSEGWVTNNPVQQPQTITVESQRQTDGDCFAVESTFELTTAFPLEIAPDFRAGFTPPFRFE